MATLKILQMAIALGGFLLYAEGVDQAARAVVSDQKTIGQRCPVGGVDQGRSEASEMAQRKGGHRDETSVVDHCSVRGSLGDPGRRVRPSVGAAGGTAAILHRILLGHFRLVRATADPASLPALVPCTAATLASNAKPVIIDTDMAGDDWMAILYLLRQSCVDVKAITATGTGEAHCVPGVQNALDLVALAGRQEIPVACGRETPLSGDHAFPAACRQRVDSLLGLSLPKIPQLLEQYLCPSWLQIGPHHLRTILRPITCSRPPIAVQ